MPLNQNLYDRLESVFGDVRICSEDEPFIAEKRRRAFTTPTKYPTYLEIIDSGEYYAVNCPVCGDTRNRLWVNHMWNQTYSGFQLKYLICCYNEGCTELDDFNEMFEELISTDSIHSVVKRVSEIKSKNITELPGITIPLTELPDNHSLRGYLETQRGFSIKELSDVWGLRWVVESDHKNIHDTNRLIIPINSIINGEEQMVAWQTRYFNQHTGDPTPPSKKIPKYLIQGPTRTVVYNLQNVKHDFIVLCEGVFDAIRVGRDHGVCSFGKHLTSRQAELIEDTIIADGGFVVFAFDPDVSSKQWEKLQKRTESWPNTKYLRFSEGVDIADYTQGQIDDLLSGIEALNSQRD